MNINWKVRLQNKTWLASVAAAVITFVYTLLDLLGLCPQLTEATVIKLMDALLFILAALGVVIDPTTEGAGDSQRAMTYETPWRDETR